MRLSSISALLIIIGLFCFLSPKILAREFNPQRWKSSKTRSSVQIVTLNEAGTAITSSKTLRAGLEFSSTGIIIPKNIGGKDYYPVHVLPFSSDDFENSPDFYNSVDEGKKWYMSIDYLNSEEATLYYENVRIKPVVEVGFLYLPFKVRPTLEGNLNKNRTLTMEANLGATLNLNFKTNVPLLSILNIPFNLSLFTDKVNKYNSYDGIDQEDALNGLSIASGLVFDIKDGVQIGVLTGADFGMDDPGKRWVYDGRIWYSFGIGYKFIRNSAQNNQ